MTPLYVTVRAIAAALLDGPWERTSMLQRVFAAVAPDDDEEDKVDVDDWRHAFVDAAHGRFATRPRDVCQLAAWLFACDDLHDVMPYDARVIRFATPAPEMADSRWPVPALATTRELAMWLGIDRDALDVLADRRGISRASRDPRGRHYRYTWIAKPTGGHRLVEAPKPRLRAVQRDILDGIVARIPPHAATHGFRTGRSVASFATPHVGHAVVLRVDLRAFFASVFAGRVLGIFWTAGYPVEVARTLAALCTHRTPSDVLATAPERDPFDLARLRTPHLPQGAPTSGALANLAAYRLDVRVAAFAATLGATYTRYADDLVLSGDNPKLVRAATTIVARLAAIAEDEGFVLNFRKTRVMTAATRQRITGIVVNEKLSVTRSEVERLRAILHNCVRHGPVSQNRDAHPDFQAHLRGRVAWITSVDPRRGARLRAVLDEIRWP